MIQSDLEEVRMSEASFTLDGRTFPPDKPAANIFAFCALMAGVVGRKLRVSDVLPADFDWRPRCGGRSGRSDDGI